MKTHIIISAACALCLASCYDSSTDVATAPAHSLSFTQPAFFLPSQGSVAVVAKLTQPADRNISVPVNFGGTAEEGVDYTADKKEIDISAGQLADTIYLKSLGTVKRRQIDLQIAQAPDGYDFGFYRSTSVPIAARPVLTATWDKTSYELKTSVLVEMTLYNDTRKYTYPTTPVHVPLEVDPSSTAVLGTHFEFVGSTEPELIMANNNSTARATIHLLKKEAGHDKLVLRLKESEYFLAGAENRTTITLTGSTDVSKMAGTWTLTGLSNTDAIRNAADIVTDESDAANLPSNCPATDKITFRQNADGSLTLDTSGLTGDLTKYLRNATYTMVNEQEEELWETDYNSPEKGSVLTMNASLVNYYFSSTQVSERSANVGFRLLDNNRTLEMRIYQYEPQDFLRRCYERNATSTYNKGDIMKRGFTLIYKFKK